MGKANFVLFKLPKKWCPETYVAPGPKNYRTGTPVGNHNSTTDRVIRFPYKQTL